MKADTYRWFTWAVTNTAASAGTPSTLLGMHAEGAGVAGLLAVKLAADVRSLIDLDAVYGPYAAVTGPAAVTAASYLGSGHSLLPATFSMALAVLARSAASRKGKVK